ncbi:MAG: single-stranded DNA-binding protein [Candidatus Hydrogenedens sp.]
MSDIRVPDLNIVLIAGRLIGDPETRATPTGRTVTKFTIANNRRFKGKDGEVREERLFISIVSWDSMADYAYKYLRKGGPVLVEGRLRMDKWNDPTTNQRRSRFEIVARSIQQLDWGTGSSGKAGQGSIPPNEKAVPNMNNYPNQDKGTFYPEENYPDDSYPMPEDDVPF